MLASATVVSSRVVNLTLEEGRLDGVVRATMPAWDGKAFSSPRHQADRILKRPEAGWAGIYVLSWFDQEQNKLQIYIGEADSVRERVTYQLRQDAFEPAQRVAFVVGKEEHWLNKAHCRFLEGQLIRLAKKADKAHLINAVEMNASRLSMDLISRGRRSPPASNIRGSESPRIISSLRNGDITLSIRAHSILLEMDPRRRQRPRKRSSWTMPMTSPTRYTISKTFIAAD